MSLPAPPPSRLLFLLPPGTVAADLVASELGRGPHFALAVAPLRGRVISGRGFALLPPGPSSFAPQQLGCPPAVTARLGERSHQLPQLHAPRRAQQRRGGALLHAHLCAVDEVERGREGVRRHAVQAEGGGVELLPRREHDGEEVAAGREQRFVRLEAHVLHHQRDVTQLLLAAELIKPAEHALLVRARGHQRRGWSFPRHLCPPPRAAEPGAPAGGGG